VFSEAPGPNFFSLPSPKSVGVLSGRQGRTGFRGTPPLFSWLFRNFSDPAQERRLYYGHDLSPGSVTPPFFVCGKPSGMCTQGLFPAARYITPVSYLLYSAFSELPVQPAELLKLIHFFFFDPPTVDHLFSELPFFRAYFLQC